MIDTAYSWIGFLVLALIVLGAALGVARRPRSPWPQRLLILAVALRIVGALARYEVLFGYYGGSGDAAKYFSDSLPVSDELQSFEVSPFSASFWAGDGRWWGTPFLEKVSSLALALIGPTLRGEFLVFSLLAFAGLVAIARAFGRVQPERAVTFAAWIWLWPSLWFWPSSVGKEAVIMLAMGIATLGYVGTRGRIRWGLLLAGIGLAFCIRPHVAAVLAMAVLAAHWLASWQRATPRRVLEAAAALAVFVFALFRMSGALGLEQPDVESVRDLVEWQQGQTLQGGSNIGGVPVSVAGIPMAFVNIWMRPFPWEARNATSLVSALEIVAFWWLVWRRRRETLVAFRHWRRHRLLRFSLPLLVTYTLMIGIAFGNLGIIARQRAPIFPFMLVFVVAVPALQRVPRSVAIDGHERETVDPKGAGARA
jgi:hypothetical protein